MLNSKRKLVECNKNSTLIKHRGYKRVFWLIIAKSRIYLHYSHCSKLFRELRKESEFRQRCCPNSTKVWERKREKILNFGNGITEIPADQETNCGNAIAEIGKKNLWQLWQCHCQKWERKKIVVAAIWGGIKKKSATFTIFLQYFYNKSQMISYN